MKTYEKLIKLEQEYLKARQRILTDKTVNVEIVVKEVKAKLLKNNGPKSSTE